VAFHLCETGEHMEPDLTGTYDMPHLHAAYAQGIADE
jgi:hypothetical protein